jgi:hypothetical protein
LFFTANSATLLANPMQRPETTTEQESMAAATNGIPHNQSNGSPRATTTSERAARRIVLLTADERSEINEVLIELRGDEITGRRLHTEIQMQAAAHAGRWVAAEWQAHLGWTRFLWCRK